MIHEATLVTCQKSDEHKGEYERKKSPYPKAEFVG